MTAFIYDETEYAFRKNGGGFNPDNVDVNKHYLIHYGNLMILELFYSTPRSFAEKCQLEKEMTIAKKKMDFWSKFKNFDRKIAEDGVKAIKKQWKKT